MNRVQNLLLASGIAATLALGGVTVTTFAAGNEHSNMAMPKSAADCNAETVKTDQEAVALESKAEHHAKMAAIYHSLVSGGSKQADSFRSLANHCDALAASYRQAARDARAMAQSLRDMAKVA